jgi:hypothetical protein
VTVGDRGVNRLKVTKKVPPFCDFLHKPHVGVNMAAISYLAQDKVPSKNRCYRRLDSEGRFMSMEVKGPPPILFRVSGAGGPRLRGVHIISFLN